MKIPLRAQISPGGKQPLKRKDNEKFHSARKIPPGGKQPFVLGIKISFRATVPTTDIY